MRIFLLICVFLTGSLAHAATHGFDLKITLKDDIIKVGHPVEGKVAVTNMYGAGLPAIFNIELFHEDSLVDRITTSVPKVPNGITEFSFKRFGIPFFNEGPDSIGTWRIRIIQQNIDAEDAAQALFAIVP